MKVDALVNAQPLRRMQEIARDAEAAGFAGLTITEAGRTAYLSAAAAALVTGLDLATGVAVAFPRSPMVTASNAWELADVSGGRFRLGLGTQVRAHIERRYSAEFDPPGPRLREYVLALRAIFRAFAGDERLAFDGDHWSMDLLPREWSPGPIDAGAPPIDLAAVNPWMLRMAAEVADGVHVHPLNTPTYLEQTLLPNLAAGAAAAGRPADEVTVHVPCFTVVGDTEDERAARREAARFQIAFYGSTPNYAYLFEQLDREGTTPRLQAALKAKDLGAVPSIIDDDLLRHFVVECPWDGLADALVDRYEGTASRVVLYFAGRTWDEDRTAFARLGEAARDVHRRTGPTS
ncbi:MAG: TIGR03617 family F420-dependent LLM class oxidoreductase [Acidimicrobiales bacterium]|nr:TIGR03617 family F420-dependent LLM class oxidoreductase [Acidimicrobiales bacterium]MCB9374037.1 TIGR03617 family F420-dependent LLM class oxidoreductase [Microthrixaceae bacterium]